MRQQLFDLEQQKNRFLQQISHDLKTPLTALREGAQLLSDEVVGTLTPEQREIAQILRHNSIELQRQIEELLNYGAIQFHRLKLELAPVNPRQVLERVTQNQKLALQAKNLTLRTRSTDAVVIADAEKIGVVLDNLLSNAIKFSPADGTITVNMHSNADSLDIDVIDEGAGVAAADRARVFEPYYQGRRHRETVRAGADDIDVVAGRGLRGIAQRRAKGRARAMGADR